MPSLLDLDTVTVRQAHWLICWKTPRKPRHLSIIIDRSLLRSQSIIVEQPIQTIIQYCQNVTQMLQETTDEHQRRQVIVRIYIPIVF